MGTLIFIAAIIAVVWGWSRRALAEEESEPIALGCLQLGALLFILGIIGGFVALMAAGPGAVIGFIIVLFFLSLIFTGLTGIK